MYRVLTPTRLSRCVLQARFQSRVAVPWAPCLGVAGLHVFVRHTRGYAEVEVHDEASVAALLKAAIAKLGLNLTPDSLRLSLEVENGSHKALDSRKKLAAQGVFDGSSVVVMEALKVASAPLPAPLSYSIEVLGGELVAVADLQGSPEFVTPYPFFLTPLQLAEMEGFLRFTGPPSTPKMLVITGTIKSGKTRIVVDIIPRLLSLYYSQAPITTRLRPVFFHHEFTPDVPAAPAVRRLVRKLRSFARSLGISLGDPEEEVMLRGVEEVLFKLRVESRRDTAVGLERMKIGERLALRQLAVRGILPRDYPLSSLARLLCEDENGGPLVRPLSNGGEEAPSLSPTGHSSGTQLRLLPPYGTLLSRWIRADGMLSIVNLATGQPLAPRVIKSLLTLTENLADYSEVLKRDMSTSVLGAMANSGMGVPQPNSLVRPPVTVAELMAIPAIIYLLETLEYAAKNSAGKAKPSSTAKLFREAAEAGSEEQAKFMAEGGVAVLNLMDNALVHASFDTKGVSECGLTEAAVDTVVQWAADEVVQRMGDRYYFNEHGLLLRRRKRAA